MAEYTEQIITQEEYICRLKFYAKCIREDNMTEIQDRCSNQIIKECDWILEGKDVFNEFLEEKGLG